MHEYLDNFLQTLNRILTENPGASYLEIKETNKLEGSLNPALGVLRYLEKVDCASDGKGWRYWVKGEKPSDVVDVPFSKQKGELTALQRRVWDKCLEQQQQRHLTPRRMFRQLKGSDPQLTLNAVCTAMSCLRRKGKLVELTKFATGAEHVYAVAETEKEISEDLE